MIQDLILLLIFHFSIFFLFCFLKLFYSRNNRTRKWWNVIENLTFLIAGFLRLQDVFVQIRLFWAEPRNCQVTHRESLFFPTRYCHNFQIRLNISTNALWLTTQHSVSSERQQTTSENLRGSQSFLSFSASLSPPLFSFSTLLCRDCSFTVDIFLLFFKILLSGDRESERSQAVCGGRALDGGRSETSLSRSIDGDSD